MTTIYISDGKRSPLEWRYYCWIHCSSCNVQLQLVCNQTTLYRVCESNQVVRALCTCLPIPCCRLISVLMNLFGPSFRCFWHICTLFFIFLFYYLREIILCCWSSIEIIDIHKFALLSGRPYLPRAYIELKFCQTININNAPWKRYHWIGISSNRLFRM